MKIQVEAADVQLLHQHSPYRRVSTGQGGTRATQDSICAWHQNLSSEKAKQKKQREILASEEVQRDIASPRHYDLWSLCTGPKGLCRWHLEKMLKASISKNASELITESHCYDLLCAEQLFNTGKIWQISAMIHIWLVVSTILKNISQWEGLSRVLWKIKHVWNHQPDIDPLAATVRATCCHVPR